MPVADLVRVASLVLDGYHITALVLLPVPLITGHYYW